jgi:HEAT repeat protein
LYIVGTVRCIPLLEKLLADPDASHMARYVLARLEYPEAAVALHRALAGTSGAARVGIINSLGELRHEPAVNDLVELLQSDDLESASAAARSLGCIGDRHAVKALRDRRNTAPSGLRQRIDHALLFAAEGAVTVGRTDEAAATYRLFYTDEFPIHFRRAGLRGLMGIEGAAPTDLLVKAIQDEDPVVRSQMIAIMTDAQGSSATRMFANLLPSLPVDSQIEMLSMLAVRGDSAAVPAVTKAMQSDQEVLRLAAIDALGALGDETAVPVLVLHAVASSGAERNRARSSLVRLMNNSVNPALAGLLKHSEAAVRSEAARSLAARGAVEMADAVMKLTDDRDPSTRKEAIKALKSLAGAKQIPALLSVLLNCNDNVWRAQVEQTALAVVRRIPEKEQVAVTGLRAMNSAKTGTQKASLFRILGASGHASALPSLLAGAKDANLDVKDVAIRALAAWPDAAAREPLYAIALDAGNSQLHRVLAMRGYIEMIAIDEEASDEELLHRYTEASKNAVRSEEMVLVLSKLSSFGHPDALALVRRMKDNPQLKDAAAAAEQRIDLLLNKPADLVTSHNGHNARQAMDGDPTTRWDTGSPMKGGEWFTIDMGYAKSIRGVTMDSRGSNDDYARSYEIYTSLNEDERGTLVTKGDGTGPLIDIVFEEPVTGRTLTIVQTGRTDGPFWSLHELAVKTEDDGAAQTERGRTAGEPIKVMILGGQNNHNWKESNAYLWVVLDREKHIAATISNAPEEGASPADKDAWRPQFENYDCVILNYNGDMWTERVKAEFQNYIRNGGSAFAIHAANNSFTGWKEYEKMIGMLWRGSDYGASLYFAEDGSIVREEPGKGRGMGHGGQYHWTMTTRDRNNPVTRDMPLHWMHRHDELYHGQRGPAENMNILLSAYSDPKNGGTGKDEPIVWWISCGKGKVMTNVMGHELKGLTCKGFHAIMVRAIEWMSGSKVSPLEEDFPAENHVSFENITPALQEQMLGINAK